MQADFKFDNSFRLKSANDFSYLRSDSLTAKNKHFISYYKKSKVSGLKTRIGVAVSKKVGNAVVRNRFKRLIREYFRKSPFKELDLDILIVPSKNLKNLMNDDSFSETFNRSLGELFNKIIK